jgi:hypothetical protein
MHELEGLGGFTLYIRTTHEDVLWVNYFISELEEYTGGDPCSFRGEVNCGIVSKGEGYSTGIMI